MFTKKNIIHFLDLVSSINFSNNMMLLYNILLIIIFLYGRSNAVHRMYDTTHTTINTAFDCLYNVHFGEFSTMDQMEYMPSVYNEVMRYCRRLTMTSNQDLVSNGQAIPFDRLRQMGISASQLFKWNAPIDVIEEYILGKKAGVLVNCSGRGNLWFGPHCEYTFDSALTLYPLLNERFDAKKNVPESILSITNGTCYELNGVECNSIICLDWREICDGKNKFLLSIQTE